MSAERSPLAGDRSPLASARLRGHLLLSTLSQARDPRGDLDEQLVTSPRSPPRHPWLIVLVLFGVFALGYAAANRDAPPPTVNRGVK